MVFHHQVASHSYASTVRHLAAVYAPALAEHFLVAAGHGGTGVFAWRGGRLRHVQQLPGDGVPMPLAAENVTLLMTTGGESLGGGAWGGCGKPGQLGGVGLPVAMEHGTRS